MNATEVDRRVLSMSLFDMADRFTFEASWLGHSLEESRLCMEIASRLCDHARIVLSHGDVGKAEAYLDAGELTLELMKEKRA